MQFSLPSLLTFLLNMYYCFVAKYILLFTNLHLCLFLEVLLIWREARSSPARLQPPTLGLVSASETEPGGCLFTGWNMERQRGNKLPPSGHFMRTSNPIYEGEAFMAVTSSRSHLLLSHCSYMNLGDDTLKPQFWQYLARVEASETESTI